MKLSNTKSSCWRGLLAAVILGLLSVHSVEAQVPQLINYQGRVVVGSTNFNGSGQFKFALVDTTGATTYWSNDGTSVAGASPTAAVQLTVTQGLYSVQLGDSTLANMTAIPASVFNNSDVRLRVWFNDGSHGFQQLAPDQRIAAVGYAMIAANVPNGAITSAQLANGAVGTAQLAPNTFLNGTAANVPLSGITGAGAGVLNAAANPVNSANGLPALDANGLLNPNTSPGLGLQVGSNSTLNVVCSGDSITVGTGASVQPPMVPAVPLGLTTLKQANSTYWVASLRQMGFCENGKTVWNMGQGSQRIADAVAQYTNSTGVNVTATLTTGSTSGTFTSLGTAGYVQSGEVVTAYGLPSNTTASFTSSSTACSITTDGSGNASTIAVTGSTAGLANGMFVLSNNGGIYNSNVNITPGTTITISGSTITLSAPLNVWQTFGKTVPCTLYFVSPGFTLSQAFTGPTITGNVNFGGTLITSSGTFTSGSTSVTGVTTTGSSAGLISNMGIGSMATAPGATFTVSGSTLTLSQPATASGTFTFYASTPTYNRYTPINTYREQTNTTPHLLSPAVTGVPGVFLNFYGINDAGNGGDLTGYGTTYLALNALARADGYTVIDMTQVPLTSTAAYGYGNYTALQDSMAAWTRAQAYPGVAGGWDYLIDIAAAFPQGHPATDIYHISDGIHPNDLGHQLIAGLVNDALFKDITPSSSTLAYPFTNGGINENWLPPTTVLTDKANTFGTVSSAAPTTVYGPIDSIGVSGAPVNPGLGDIGIYGYVAGGGNAELDFGTSAADGVTLTTAWEEFYNSSSQTFSISNLAGTTGITQSSSAINFFAPQSSDMYEFATGSGHRYILSHGDGTGTLIWQGDEPNYVGYNWEDSSGTSMFYLDPSAKNATVGQGNLIINTAGKTISIKGGANAASGTVTLTSGTATITSSAITANSVIFFSRVASGGVPGLSQPVATVSAGSATVTSLPTDNSTYNWAMILVNQ